MADLLPGISDSLREFCEAQPVFFVGTAAPTGRVNVSPKGLDTFRVLDDHTVAYLDLTGSGIETVAHLQADGRITVMFCAFSGPPKVVRLYGQGRVVRPDGDPDGGATDLFARFPALPGARSVVVVDVDRVTSSCGFGVPRFELEAPREELVDWAESRGPDGLASYRERRNAASIDGLPGW
jgi:hypothetical protein